MFGTTGATDFQCPFVDSHHSLVHPVPLGNRTRRSKSWVSTSFNRVFWSSQNPFSLILVLFWVCPLLICCRLKPFKAFSSLFIANSTATGTEHNSFVLQFAPVQKVNKILFSTRIHNFHFFEILLLRDLLRLHFCDLHGFDHHDFLWFSIESVNILQRFSIDLHGLGLFTKLESSFI
ncbi:hypothetical protein QL285_053767 [Trifolium repens]|nr:hypothetical protein QL285_053767 [Trifolium repens]